MSVWGFVQSVTRNLDEAAGLSNGVAANHHADPTVDVGGATKPAAWGEDDDELAFDDTVVAPHTGVSSAAEVESETTSDVGTSDAIARPVTAASTPPAESESPQVVEKAHPPTTASAPTVPSADAIHVAALSGQTERLSRALAKAETENARLQEELRQALALRASTSSREEQLLEEGRQLAAEVGRERERAKALFADKRQIESKLAQLQQQLDQAALREQQAAESKQLLLAERDRLKERLQEIQGETQRHATDTESTLRELDELRGRFAASREEHQTSVEALKLAHDHALRARDAEIDRLQQENDALRYEIQQAVVQCEKRVASAERDVVAATNRALSAESRCLELTQQTAEAGADVRQDVERLQSQLAVTAAARRHAEVRITTLETELGEAKLSLRDVEASLALKIAQQQEEIMTLRKEVVTAQRQAEREKSRANALLARNEELTEEANRLLANLQAESARSMQLRLAAPPVTPNVGAAAPATSTSSVPASKPSIHVATEDEALIFIERLLMTNGSGANAGASTSGKVERALARATVELKDAQRVIAGLKRDLADLHAKHEVLLEMYGQQAEELAELTASPEKPPPPPPPAVA